MTNLEAFTARLRAVTAALAPTVGQACAEECARSIAGILADGSENASRAIGVTIAHRVAHPLTYGWQWADVSQGRERRAMTTAAVAAWKGGAT